MEKPVGRGEKDDVPFVALDVLEVFDEDRLAALFLGEGRGALLLEKVEDEVLLGFVEGHDPDGAMALQGVG